MNIERWTDERMDRLSMNVEALTRVAQLQQENVEQMQLQYQKMNTRLSELSHRLVENVTELRAGQERQERLLNYLIRRDRQRGDS